MRFIKSFLVLLILILNFDIRYTKASAKTPWEQMIEQVAKENEHLFDKDCPPDYVGQKKCFYVENPELKGKQKKVKVPKRAPKSPAPVDLGVAVITSILLNTESGSLIVEQGEQAINDLDMYLYEQLPKRDDVASFLHDLGSGAYNNFNNITQDIADYISDVFGTKIEDILGTLPNNYDQHPTLYNFLKDAARYEIVSSNPIIFYESEIAVNDIHYVALLTGVQVEYWSGVKRYRAFLSRTRTPNYNSIAVYPKSKQYVTSNIYDDLSDAIAQASAYYSVTNVVPASVFYDNLRAQDRDAIVYLPSNSFSSKLQSTLQGVVAPPVPATPSKVGITTIDNTDYFDFDIPNPYFVPDKPESPTDNPKDIPFYIPMSNPNAPPIIGTIPNPNTVGNPSPDPEPNPNPDPTEPPDPNKPEEPSVGEPPVADDHGNRWKTLFTTKFPFSLPWDLYYVISLLAAEPQTPVFEGKIYDAEFKIDLSFLDSYIGWFRTFLIAGFIYLLILLHPRLMGGAK